MKLRVIPARGGSKRIPRKNIKKFCGQSIIIYSIKTAMKSGCFDHIVVSTDDIKIANIAKSFGASVPFLRPKKLANDYVGVIPVVKHAIEWFNSQMQSPSEVCCVYPTAPFLKPISIRKGYNQMKRTGADYCFTATSFDYPIQRAIQISVDNRVKMLNPKYIKTRSQDLKKVYHDAGQFYWGKAKSWITEKPLFSKNATAYILPRYLVQDIDTLEDWTRAELMYLTLKKIKI